MAGEIQFSYRPGLTTYAEIRNTAAQIWNTASGAFMAYLSGMGNTTVAGTEQGLSSYYQANFPSTINPGVYNVRARQQLGGSPAESDTTIAVGDVEWDGTSVLPRSNLATSGQVGQIGPIRIAKGTQLLNLPLYLKSSADHVTAFTSGIVSGQISRDGGAFGVLQSGTVSEVGQGFFKVNLTSGDTNANTLALLFTAVGVSGGAADPLPMAMVTQKVSG